MDAASLRAVYLRLSWDKLRRSRVSWAAGAVLIALSVVFWVKDSGESARGAFLALCPYLFLVLTQDMMRGEIDSGSLENVLFIDGGFRRYLRLKNLVVAGCATAFTAGMFVVLSLPALWTGTFSGRRTFPLLGIAVAAGLYYVWLGTTLGLFLKGGSNVMLVLVVQAGLALVLILTAGAKGGVLTCLETGTFPSFGARLAFLGFAALCPNPLVSARFLPYAVEFLSLAAGLWLVQALAIGRLELARR